MWCELGTMGHYHAVDGMREGRAMRGRKVEGAGKPKVIEVGGDGPLLVIHGGAGKRLQEMSAE